jgi:hypothetical protein
MEDNGSCNGFGQRTSGDEEDMDLGGDLGGEGSLKLEAPSFQQGYVQARPRAMPRKHILQAHYCAQGIAIAG